MTIKRLVVNDVRNLSSLSVVPSPSINLFFGENGSGKTSILESIYLLGVGRSFRTTSYKPVIRHSCDRLTVFAELENDTVSVPVGISRGLGSDSFDIRISGKSVRSLSDLAKLLPVQIINPDTFKLLEGSPKLRRQFIDWGVFHVKHDSFLLSWKNMQKALRQRNTILRLLKRSSKQQSDSELSVWTNEFIKSSHVVDQLRQAYFADLKPLFATVLDKLTPLREIDLTFYCGWDKKQSLEQVLQASFDRDVQLGYTNFGPQKADIKIKIDGVNAADVLSRGQTKLVVCALKLAQGLLLNQISGCQTVFLIDDLPAELDAANRSAVVGLLSEMNCQTFITCIDSTMLYKESCWPTTENIKVFHVKHGAVIASENFLHGTTLHGGG